MYLVQLVGFSFKIIPNENLEEIEHQHFQKK